MVIHFQNWWPQIYQKVCLSDDSFGRYMTRDDKISFQISKYNEFIFSNSFKGNVKCSTFIGGLVEYSFTLVSIPNVDKHYPQKEAYLGINSKIPIEKRWITISN